MFRPGDIVRVVSGPNAGLVGALLGRSELTGWWYIVVDDFIDGYKGAQFGPYMANELERV